jgi:hypothetical protein
MVRRGYRLFAGFFFAVFLFAVFFLGGAERSTLGLNAHHIGMMACSANAISDDECTDWVNIERSPSVCAVASEFRRW